MSLPSSAAPAKTKAQPITIKPILTVLRDSPIFIAAPMVRDLCGERKLALYTSTPAPALGSKPAPTASWKTKRQRMLFRCLEIFRVYFAGAVNGL
jgi:hypothetical protein